MVDIAQLSQEEIEVIDTLYAHFKERGEWCGARTINHKFGRSLLEKILSKKPPSLIQLETNNSERNSVYKLTFEGLDSCSTAKEDMNLLDRYLDLLIKKFNNNPEILEVFGSDIDSKLELNKQQSRLLRDFIYIGNFWGGSASLGEDWKVGVPDDIEDLVELGPDKYINKHRRRFWEQSYKGVVLEKKVDQETIKTFISYSVKDKSIAGRIKIVLSGFGVDAFLAHDDIRVSLEYR